jgi:DNA gyrase/topoisomerase IV subunit A
LPEYTINLYQISKVELNKLRELDKIINHTDYSFYLNNIIDLKKEINENIDRNRDKIIELGDNKKNLKLGYETKIEKYDIKVKEVIEKIIQNDDFINILNKIFRKDVKSIFDNQFISRTKKEKKKNELYFYNAINDIILFIGKKYKVYRFEGAKLNKDLEEMIDYSKDNDMKKFIVDDFFTLCFYYFELNNLNHLGKNDLTDENWNKIEFDFFDEEGKKINDWS